ncbi:hypothetical protein FHG87_011634 [Trinorchestia longiramus]|nr:hypothetical protein FHG87_011634 [Trinorchestia longiramus]
MSARPGNTRQPPAVQRTSNNCNTPAPNTNVEASSTLKLLVPANYLGSRTRMTVRAMALVIAVLLGLLQLMGPSTGVHSLSLTSKESSSLGGKSLQAEKGLMLVPNKALFSRFTDFRKRRRNTLSHIDRNKHECLCHLLVRYERNNCCRKRARCC